MGKSGTSLRTLSPKAIFHNAERLKHAGSEKKKSSRISPIVNPDSYKNDWPGQDMRTSGVVTQML